MHLVTDYKNADVITHNGIFHLDEIAAITLYEIATGKDLAIARLNKVPNDFKGVAIDIGDDSGRTDIPIFDHHTPLRGESKDDRSSCGKVFDAYKDILVEKLFGPTVDKDFAESIFRADLLTPIQNCDTYGGVDFDTVETHNSRGEISNFKAKTISLSSAFRQLNPPFFEKEKTGEMFTEAYSLFKDILNTYSNLLTKNLEENNIRKHYTDPTNFHNSRQSFDISRVSELNNPKKSDVLTSNINTTMRNCVLKSDKGRILMLAHTFCLGNKSLSERIFNAYKTGLEKNQQGLDLANEILSKKAPEILQNKGQNNVLVLDTFMPWKNFVLKLNNAGENWFRDKTVPLEPNSAINFVVFPSLRDENLWYITPVQDPIASKSRDGEFPQNKKVYKVPFPDKYLNATSEELSKLTNGKAEFCSDFLIECTSKEAAILLAEEMSKTAKNLSFPEGTETISSQDYDLPKSTYESVTIPNSVDTIEAGAFEHFTNIEKITIPGGTRVNTGACSNCRNLKEVEILPGTESHPGITTMGHYVFAGCPNLKKVTLPDSFEYISPSYFTDSSISNFTITLTSMNTKNLLNAMKIGNQMATIFPNVQITIDASPLGRGKLSFETFNSIIVKAAQEFGIDFSAKPDHKPDLNPDLNQGKTSIAEIEEENVNRGNQLTENPGPFEFVDGEGENTPHTDEINQGTNNENPVGEDVGGDEAL